MRNILWKKPIVWGLALLLIAALGSISFFLGDSLEDRHGRIPRDLPPLFERALTQKDGVTISQLATSTYATEVANLYEISLAQGKQNEKTFSSNWIMEEFKISNDHYIYKLEWINEVGRIGMHYRVRKMNDEWKIERISGNIFDLETKGVTSKIIRGNAE